MTDTTIEAGRWYRRTRDGLVVRATTRMVSVCGWWATPLDREVIAVPIDRESVEPWVPRVGEWVRLAWPGGGRGDGTQVLAYDPHGGRVLVRCGVCRLSACEPCAPPAEALKDTDRDSLKDTPPEVSHRRDDGTRCHRCGGPAYTGLGVGGRQQCLAPRCEPVAELEPTVREVWLSVRGTVVDAGHPRSERIYVAEGRGVSAQHPLRAEAVARWREMVGRR